MLRPGAKTRTVIINGVITRVPVDAGASTARQQVAADPLDSSKPLISKATAVKYGILVAILAGICYWLGTRWGSIAFIVFCILGIFTMGLRRARAGETSAYSIFAGRELPGQLRSEQFTAEIRGGVGAMADRARGEEDAPNRGWENAGAGYLVDDGGRGRQPQPQPQGQHQGQHGATEDEEVEQEDDDDEAAFDAELQEALRRSANER
jgi:hypothetical protein